MSLDWEVLGLTNQVRCQCPLSLKPGLTRMHREMNSETTSSGSPLRAAVPAKRAKVAQKVQTNQTHTRSGRDERSAEKYEEGAGRDDQKHAPDGGRSGHVDKKQGQEFERLWQEYKEQSEQVALTMAVEKVIPARDIPRGQSPMELLTPREMSQTTETRLPAETNRVTIPDPSDTLGDPVVEQTVRRLIETADDWSLTRMRQVPG